MGPRAGLDGWNISSPLRFDPGPSNSWSVAILTELPGPHRILWFVFFVNDSSNLRVNKGREMRWTGHVARMG